MDDLNNKTNYEQEQIQRILLKESEKYKILNDRKLKESQEKEYLKSLKIDTQKNLTFDQPSIEEMRRVRLKRFSN